MLESAAKHVFISYVHEDRDTVTRLRDALALGGVRVWTDAEIPPGDFWESVLRERIEGAGFMLACYSAAAAARQGSYMDRELEMAARVMGPPTRERQWLIPVLLSDMPVPTLRVAGLERLDAIQWVDLHRAWDEGVARIRDDVLETDPPVLGRIQPACVFVSDVHTTLAPLVRPQQLPEALRMLADPDAYARFYADGRSIAGTHFVFRPLGAREMEKNHFWRRVRDLEGAELQGPWHRHLPIVCEPRALQLALDPALGPGASARCFAFLWPGGWSSNLEIDLPDPVGPDALAGVVAGLRARRSAGRVPPALRFDGAPVNATRLFELMAGRLREELGASPESPLRDTTDVSGNVVLGVADAGRQAAGYFRLPRPARMRVHQLLRGRALTLEDLDEAERREPGGEPRLLLTRLRRRNFILTLFGRGSVVVASDGWEKDLPEEERMDARVMRCLAGNVRASTAQALMLAYFAARAEQSGYLEVSPGLRTLTASARRQLRLLRESGSRFEKSFCRAHRTILRTLPAQAAGAAGEESPT